MYPPKKRSYVEILMPNMMVLRGEVLGHVGRSFMSKINFPIKETPTDLTGPFIMQNKAH